MELFIYRYHYRDDCTLGIAVAGDLRFQALELPWLSNRNNVSCIPEGVYTVTPALDSSKIKFLVHDVPDRTGIQIEVGNKPQDIRGCILLGMGLDITSHPEPWVTQSSKALRELAKYFSGLKQATLIIKHISGALA